MKSFLLSLILFMGIGAIPALALETTQTVSPALSATGTLENPLLVTDTTIVDDAHVTIAFNQDVVLESVRVRITKQSDGSNVKIDTITGSLLGKNTVTVNLGDLLEPTTAYKITIVSAISESNVVIKDGADALREFSTPALLKKSTPEFNAPANPNAVMVKTDTGMNQPTATGKIDTKVPEPKELPLTGMNPTIFLLIA
jgi:hypothetical protein